MEETSHPAWTRAQHGSVRCIFSAPHPCPSPLSFLILYCLVLLMYSPSRERRMRRTNAPHGALDDGAERCAGTVGAASRAIDGRITQCGEGTKKKFKF